MPTRRNKRSNGGTRRRKSGFKKLFHSHHELTRFLEKNYSWMKRVNVYLKEDFKNHLPAKYEFVKYEFPKIYRIGDLNNYVFRIFR
jgi:hypothetical protein